ncbi:MAG TPA: carbonic anhydrase [Candidatus Polarisedimenticolaceae bacterium]|nr:carbonic anhydrase [Candidatus Polarisedimenticolaceae bacterium]
MTGLEALARLREGNDRFLRGEARFPTLQKEVLAELAKGQRPFATILGCSDSRVPPELLFDAGFGQLFVIRVAGNVVSPEIFGTMQYAAVHLETNLFVVLGHDECGAVKAALATKTHGHRERERIQALADTIAAGLPDPDPTLDQGAQLTRAVEANVRAMMGRVLETPEAQARLREGKIHLVGAVVAITTGQVRFLE